MARFVFILFLVGRGRNAKDKCMFLLYLHAISVSNSKASAADASHGLHMDFSTKVKSITIVLGMRKNMLTDFMFQVAPNMCMVLCLKAIKYLFLVCQDSWLGKTHTYD